MTISKYSICIVLHHFHLVYIVYTINTISKHILPEPEELKTRLINVSTIHNKWRHYSSRNFDLFFHISVNFDKNLWVWMSMIQQNSKKIHTSNFITNRRLTFSTNKRTDVWSRDFIIWMKNWLWAVGCGLGWTVK